MYAVQGCFMVIFLDFWAVLIKMTIRVISNYFDGHILTYGFCKQSFLHIFVHVYDMLGDFNI